MTKPVAYSSYRVKVLNSQRNYRKYEVWRRCRLLLESPPTAGRALSYQFAGTSRGNSRYPGHPGELPAPAPDRAEARRPGREPERAERRVYARAAAGKNHDGGRRRDNRGRLHAGRMPRRKLDHLPAGAAMRDARRMA